MTINKDTATTVLGIVIAGATAAQPILNAAQGSLHSQDYLSLLTSVIIAIFGWLTNKKEVSNG